MQSNSRIKVIEGFSVTLKLNIRITASDIGLRIARNKLDTACKSGDSSAIVLEATEPLLSPRRAAYPILAHHNTAALVASGDCRLRSTLIPHPSKYFA